MTDCKIYKCPDCGKYEAHPMDEQPPVFCGTDGCHSPNIAPVSDELPFGETRKEKQARLIGEIMRDDEKLGLYFVFKDKA